MSFVLHMFFKTLSYDRSSDLKKCYGQFLNKIYLQRFRTFYQPQTNKKIRRFSRLFSLIIYQNISPQEQCQVPQVRSKGLSLFQKLEFSNSFIFAT